MKYSRQREKRGRQRARTQGEEQGGRSVCAGCQEHVLLLIMGKGLMRQYWKPFSKVIRLLFYANTIVGDSHCLSSFNINVVGKART